MKKNIKILILSIVLIVAMVGCAPADKNMRNLSTQTRLRDDNVNNRFMNDNLTQNRRDGVGNNLNNGMVRNDDNGTVRNGDGMLGNNNNTLRNTPMGFDSLGDTNGMNNGMNNGTLRNNTNLSTSMTGMRDRATAIAQRVNALPEVDNASVLINGDTAIVGCDVEGDATNRINSDLRKKVEAAVKVADKNIKNVSVTSDPTIYSRIKTMSTDMNNGNPAKNFTQDIEDIMRDITNVR